MMETPSFESGAFNDLDFFSAFPADGFLQWGTSFDQLDATTPSSAAPTATSPSSPCISLSDLKSSDSTAHTQRMEHLLYAYDEQPVTGIFVDKSFRVNEDVHSEPVSSYDTWPWTTMDLAEEEQRTLVPAWATAASGLLTPMEEGEFDMYGVVSGAMLRTPIDERSMSVSSIASSQCRSDSDSPSPLMSASRLPATPPPSPAYQGISYVQHQMAGRMMMESLVDAAFSGFPYHPYYTPPSMADLQVGEEHFAEPIVVPSSPTDAAIPIATAAAPEAATAAPQSPAPQPKKTSTKRTKQVKKRKETTSSAPEDSTTSTSTSPAPTSSSPKCEKHNGQNVLPLTVSELNGIKIAPVRATSTRTASPSAYPKPFHCELCPASFSRKHDLKRHTRIHLGIRPFKCEACAKVFSRHDALSRHIVKWGCDKKLIEMGLTVPCLEDNSSTSSSSSSTTTTAAVTELEADAEADADADAPLDQPSSDTQWPESDDDVETSSPIDPFHLGVPDF